MKPRLRVVEPSEPPKLPRIPVRDAAAEIWRRAVLVGVALSGAVYIGVCLWLVFGMWWLVDAPRGEQALTVLFLLVLLRLVYRAGWLVWRRMVRPQAPQVEVVEHRHYHVTPEN